MTRSIAHRAGKLIPIIKDVIDWGARANGTYNKRVAEAYASLGQYYLRLNEFDLAKKAAEESLAIYQEIGVTASAVHIPLMSVLARWNEQENNYEQVVMYRKRAVDLAEQYYGTDHFLYVGALGNLAAAYHAQDDTKQALEIFDRFLPRLRANLNEMFDGQSETQQLLLSVEFRGAFFGYLTLAIESGRPPGEIYSHLLAWKGAVFGNQFARLDEVVSAESQKLVRQSQELARRLSTLSSFMLYTAEDQEIDLGVLDDLRMTHEQVQRKLAMMHQPTNGAHSIDQQVDLLRSHLPSDAVFIDFQQYNRVHPSNTVAGEFDLESNLVAFIVRKEKPVELVELGPSDPIYHAATAWEAEIARGQGGTGKSVPQDAPQAKLRQLLWEPVDRFCQGANLVIVSPEGMMTDIPIAALPSQDPQRYLIEDYALVTTPNAFLLAHLTDSLPTDASENTALIVGDVDFSGRDNASSIANERFGKLPGTAREAEEIARLFREHVSNVGLTVAQGDQPTEEFIHSSADAYRYIHLATHGYFSPSNWSAAPTGAHQKLRDYLERFLPHLLTGVALAGANSPVHLVNNDSIQEDELLTALEVASLDLRNVDLAVLSACETTLGQAPVGEGMLGLQRAFQIAGVRSTVTSLWKVDDAATQSLMVEFYRNLWAERMPKQDALRQAQLTMLNQYDVSSQQLRPRGMALLQSKQQSATAQRLPPYYWAAFVLSGDWR